MIFKLDFKDFIKFQNLMSQKFRVFKLRNQGEEELTKGLDKLKEELH